MSVVHNDSMAQALDAAARNASSQIAAHHRGSAFREELGRAIPLLLVVPAAVILLQLVRWSLGVSAGGVYSGIVTLVLTIALPLGWLVVRIASREPAVERTQALAAVDAALRSSERVVTADEFLQCEHTNAFMTAAIEDAAEWVQQARDKQLNQRTTAAYRLRSAWAVIPITALGLWVASWLAQQQRSFAADDSIVASAETPGASEQKGSRDHPVVPPAEEQQPDEPEFPPDTKPRRRSEGGRMPATEIPEGDEESRGRLTQGETSESQKSSSPSSAQGAPSSQGQPSKSSVAAVRKPAKPPRPDQREAQQRKEQPQEEPSGSTAGQGSSRGSNNNAASSDWSSRSQLPTPDDEQTDEDEDVDDDDEEQESRGGVQPNMRDRRPPVNRDLQIGFGNRSNPDANGRGGPGAQKKSRGVASLVLGVPIPDRVTGQPNRGRTRVTQQRITPEAEQSDEMTAESRGSRDEAVGPIHHPELTPWLRAIVRRYFLQRRTAPSESSTQPTDSPNNDTAER